MNELLLFDLFPLGEVDGLLYLLALHLPLLAHLVDLVLCLLLHHLVDAKTLELLLDLHFVLLLERHDFRSPLLRLLDLLPRLHFLLLQQSDSVCKQLGVTFDARRG